MKMVPRQPDLDYGLEKQTPSGRKRPDGIATTNLVVSAYIGTNADIFGSPQTGVGRF